MARDAGGRITYVNAAFRRAFGGQAQDWVGRWFAVGGGDRAGAVGPGGRRRFEGHLETVVGPASMEWEETPLPEGGVLAVGRDMSTRRAGEDALRGAREAAEAAARAKETLFATVTHELRTPLNGVLGMADLLDNTGLTPEQSAYVRATRDSGRHLLALVDDVLDAAKLEAGAFALTMAAFDPAKVIQDVAELVAPRARARGLDVAVTIDADTPRAIVGDAARVRQILLNLAGNAAKFTEAGAMVISLSCDADDARDGGDESGPPRQTLVFSVRDTGPGVSPGDQARIFDAFAQADGSAARRVEGTGLGLAIVARLAGAMGGEAGLDSAAGAGSTFWVRIPFEVAEPAGDEVPLADMSVILVADRPISREAVARQLRALGAHVEIAASSAEARAAMRANRERVLLVDEPYAAALADIASTARGSLVLAAPDERGALAERLASGFGGWVVKPARPSSLAEQVARAWRCDLTPEDQAMRALDPALTAPRSGGDAGLSTGLTDGAQVLLVEDNPVNTLLARTLLSRLGAKVTAVVDGEAAVEAARAHRYDLILMDMRLPGMDGLEATRALRADAAAASRSTAVVALTANAAQADRDACLAAGMDDFLAKPVDETALAAVLARWTSQEKRANLGG